MKTKVLLFSILLLTTHAMAQPTLTAMTNNPVAGDNFTAVTCDTTGVTPGVSGAGVAWDYHTLIATSSFPFNVVTCSSTPYCDSFPGSNLALSIVNTAIDTELEYLTTNANVFESKGQYMATAAFVYDTKPNVLLQYPLTYNATFRDTSIVYFSQQSPDYNITYKATNVDAYGTLILPSGTYNNVLREHQISIQYDSIPGNSPVYEGSYEFYGWFTSDFHFVLFEIDLDSSAGSSWSLDNVAYYTSSPTGIAQIKSVEAEIQISPNPASDIINIKLSLAVVQNTSITVSDISGRVVGNINTNTLHTGTDILQYSVADLPSGVYIVHLVNDTYNISKKLVISH
jgi:hypothetical protein